LTVQNTVTPKFTSTVISMYFYNSISDNVNA